MNIVEADHRKFLKRVKHYWGRVKIVICCLTFKNSSTLDVRTVNKSHVKHLVCVFTHSCYCLQSENFVLMMMLMKVLIWSLQLSDLQQTNLLCDDKSHILMLLNKVTVILLHEKHCILIAWKMLIDQWWMMQLYSDDKSVSFWNVEMLIRVRTISYHECCHTWRVFSHAEVLSWRYLL